MQMTEETFLWLRSKLGLGEEVSFGDLYDPDVSIRFGCYYIHLCLVRYNGDISTAAAAYHSGWGTVDALLQKEEHSEDGLTPVSYTHLIPGRLIPLPRELSAGCGLAWRMPPENWQLWQSRIDPAAYDAAAEVEQ